MTWKYNEYVCKKYKTVIKFVSGKINKFNSVFNVTVNSSYVIENGDPAWPIAAVVFEEHVVEELLKRRDVCEVQFIKKKNRRYHVHMHK